MALRNDSSVISETKGSWPEAILHGLRKTKKPLRQHGRCCNQTPQRQYRLILTREAASALPQGSTRRQMYYWQLASQGLRRNRYKNILLQFALLCIFIGGQPGTRSNADFFPRGIQFKPRFTTTCHSRHVISGIVPPVWPHPILPFFASTRQLLTPCPIMAQA